MDSTLPAYVLTFEERFGVAPSTLKNCWSDFEPHLAPAQRRLLEVWLKMPEAMPCDIAKELGQTSNAVRAKARGVRRRLKSLDGGRHKMGPQLHRPLAEKLGLDDHQRTDPDTIAFVEAILGERYRWLYQAVRDHPDAYSKDIESLGGVTRHKLIRHSQQLSHCLRAERSLRSPHRDATEKNRDDYLERHTANQNR